MVEEQKTWQWMTFEEFFVHTFGIRSHEAHETARENLQRYWVKRLYESRTSFKHCPDRNCKLLKVCTGTAVVWSGCERVLTLG